ncbi:MAG: phosphate ABC transporter permease subunit PstC [Nitrospirota bacterium]|nr:phosphate ABC transporter permease subunit PstC [Nitrospirota bacterium]
MSRKPDTTPTPGRVSLSTWGDPLFKGITFVFAAGVLALLVAMFAVLWHESAPSRAAFGLGFLTDASWNPVTERFGALTAIAGTLISTLIALLVAVPISVGIALFLSELAPARLRTPFGVGIELLAAIPSIVYGMWGLFVLAPILSNLVQPALANSLGFLPLFSGPQMGIGMLTAGLVLALMITPFIASVTRDVFRMVPPQLKESAYGMGATTWEVVRDIMIPYGRKGIYGAVFLGMGRALGETMAVTFVIGNSHRLSASLFAPGNSIASTLANEFTEADGDLYLSSLVELGLVLFLITFLILGFAQLYLKRMSAPGGRS